MATITHKRIMSEFARYKNPSYSKNQLMRIESIDDSLMNYRAIIKGPENTPYYGFNFELNVRLSDNYPLEPPKIKFVTPIKHININDQGDICLDILKKPAWRSVMQIETIVVSILSLLSDPNPSDPFNSELFHLYNKDKQLYDKYIKTHCLKYAIK